MTDAIGNLLVAQRAAGTDRRVVEGGDVRQITLPDYTARGTATAVGSMLSVGVGAAGPAWPAISVTAGVDSIAVLRASTARYTNAAGLLATAAVDEARLDYDPTTHALRGLLLERGVTNLAVPSENIAGGWASSNVAAVADAAVAPDGTTTADTITDSTAGAPGRKTLTVTHAAGVNVTGSVFIQKDAIPAATRSAGFRLGNNGPTSISIDTSTGAVVATVFGGVAVGGVIDHGTYWRVWATLTPAITGSTSFQLLPAIGSPTEQGSINAWGAQLTEGELSSYVPALAAPGARAEDFMQLQPASGSYTVAVTFESGARQFLTVASSGGKLSIGGSQLNERRVTHVEAVPVDYVQAAQARGTAVVGAAGTAPDAGGSAAAVGEVVRSGAAVATAQGVVVGAGAYAPVERAGTAAATSAAVAQGRMLRDAVGTAASAALAQGASLNLTGSYGTGSATTAAVAVGGRTVAAPGAAAGSGAATAVSAFTRAVTGAATGAGTGAAQGQITRATAGTASATGGGSGKAAGSSTEAGSGVAASAATAVGRAVKPCVGQVDISSTAAAVSASAANTWGQAEADAAAAAMGEAGGFFSPADRVAHVDRRSTLVPVPGRRCVITVAGRVRVVVVPGRATTVT